MKMYPVENAVPWNQKFLPTPIISQTTTPVILSSTTTPTTPVIYQIEMADGQRGWFLPHTTQQVQPHLQYTQQFSHNTLGGNDDVFLPSSDIMNQSLSSVESTSSITKNTSSLSGDISPPNSQRNYQLFQSIDYNSDGASLNTSIGSSSPTPSLSEPEIGNFLPSSLLMALNEDIKEPKNKAKRAILKTRSLSTVNIKSAPMVNFDENGVSDDLNQCDRIKISLRSTSRLNSDEDSIRKREEFLSILDIERERQKNIALPKHAPKMCCKFCKNNGEPAEIYTKHKLHNNEKTVCPILRHYVCKRCNSSGDFAHTISHCPFNDKKDSLAWKATFL